MKNYLSSSFFFIVISSFTADSNHLTPSVADTEMVCYSASSPLEISGEFQVENELGYSKIIKLDQTITTIHLSTHMASEYAAMEKNCRRCRDHITVSVYDARNRPLFTYSNMIVSSRDNKDQCARLV